VVGFRILNGGSYYAIRDTISRSFFQVSNSSNSLANTTIPSKNNTSCKSGAESFPQSIMGKYHNAGIGICTGILNGALLHPLNAIRYRMWQTDDATMMSTTKSMFLAGSIRPFYAALQVTACREAIFGR
jgi:hypothetical protein